MPSATRTLALCLCRLDDWNIRLCLNNPLALNLFPSLCNLFRNLVKGR